MNPRKLTMKQAREIRSRVWEGESKRTVAKDFGIHHSTLDKIVKGLTYQEPGQKAVFVPGSFCVRIIASDGKSFDFKLWHVNTKANFAVCCHQLEKLGAYRDDNWTWTLPVEDYPRLRALFRVEGDLAVVPARGSRGSGDWPPAPSPDRQSRALPEDIPSPSAMAHSPTPVRQSDTPDKSQSPVRHQSDTEEQFLTVEELLDNLDRATAEDHNLTAKRMKRGTA